MLHPTVSFLRRAFLVAGGALLILGHGRASAGVQANADKEVAQQQVDANHAFPLQFSLSFGGESEFVFRGVDILPEVDIDVRKGLTQAVNAVPATDGLPSFRDFLATKGLTPKQFIGLIPASMLPTAPVGVSRESGIYYIDAHVSGYGFTLGAFYATQAEGRVDHNFFGTRPIFDAYHEFDSYVSYSRPIGPVRVSLGGTYYHVVNNSDFDTAELNFGVSYTPAQFQYVTASFAYNYAGAFNFSDYNVNGIKGEYLDGHYLEARIDGNVPVYKQVVTFNPYILVSAGSGILPRTFNPASLPTFFNTQRYGQGAEPYVAAVYKSVVTQTPLASNLSPKDAESAQAAFDPSSLDRSFDLSNFQTGFRVPFYLTRYITIRGDFNYSRPLGNLNREPYKQHDELWGGGTLTLSF